MKRLLVALAVMITMQASGQYNLDVTVDNETGDIVYRGECTFKDLSSEQAFTWLRTGVGHYNPDKASVTYLERHLKDYNIVVLMGTWCEDSHKMLPQIYKLLRITQYPMSQYKMYGLDLNKQGYLDEHEKYKVENVPTVILFNKGKEVGRVVETAKVSLEADLKDIIKKHKES